MKLTKIYLGIPYSKIDKESSYRQANEAATVIINTDGYNVFSPITHSHPLTRYGVRGDWEFWQHIDMQFLGWCDEMWILIPEEGFEFVETSTGLNGEIAHATANNIPIKYIQLINNKITDYVRC